MCRDCGQIYCGHCYNGGCPNCGSFSEERMSVVKLNKLKRWGGIVGGKNKKYVDELQSIRKFHREFEESAKKRQQDYLEREWKKYKEDTSEKNVKARTEKFVNENIDKNGRLVLSNPRLSTRACSHY